ncbi:GntR family transcriptional regulator [Actinomadura sp. 3N407]|uniref:GntR family transcriptional regulator n=1 Tax=Actinomadura sp. 3N407 TaxID=3457423 RepID=UPI003FCCBE17
MAGEADTDPDLDNRDSAVEEVRRRLLDEINGGRRRPGERLGAERALAERYGVSRNTLRQALDSLARAGLVRRTAGRNGGTFVSHRPVERDLSHVAGVPAYLRRQGYSAGTKILRTGLVEADETVRRALRLPEGTFVVELIRIRLADGIPISLEHARLPESLFPGLLERPLGGSIYQLLEECYGVRPVTVTEHIEVVSAKAAEGGLLGVDAGAPLLSIDRVARSADDVPFEHSRDLFRADRTRITVQSKNAGTGHQEDAAAVRITRTDVEGT